MTKQIDTIVGGIVYFTASLDTQDPKKRLKDKKCNQKTSKKFSVENITYKFSKSKYNLKISDMFSPSNMVWYTT